MIKKNNYIRDLDNDEIEEIKYYNRLFKRISDELEDTDVYNFFYNIHYRMDNNKLLIHVVYQVIIIIKMFIYILVQNINQIVFLFFK